MELGPPSGDRTWADVGRALRLNPSARLSAAACRELVRAYLDLRASIERIADDPASTRAQLRELVPDERQAKVRAQAAEMRRRRAEHDAWASARAGRTRTRRQLSDEEILAVPKMMALLKAVADGRVVAGSHVVADGRVVADGGGGAGGGVVADGGGGGGRLGRSVLPGGEEFPAAAARWLSDLGLIDASEALPTLTERGRRLLWLWRR